MIYRFLEIIQIFLFIYSLKFILFISFKFISFISFKFISFIFISYSLKSNIEN